MEYPPITLIHVQESLERGEARLKFGVGNITFTSRVGACGNKNTAADEH